jgi:hypothetical protein
MEHPRHNVRRKKYFRLLSFGLVCCLAVLTTSCGPYPPPPRDPAEEKAEQVARTFLQPLVLPGEAMTNITAKFGSPANQYQTRNGRLALSFFFPETNTNASAAGVGGITVFFTNNQLADWDPVYSSTTPKSEGLRGSGLFHSEKAVMMFFVISDAPKDGWRFVDTTDFPKLGYVNLTPDLVIFSGRFLLYTDRSDPEKPPCKVDLELSEPDGETLKNLTTENIGKRIAVCAGPKIVTAPLLQTPIVNGTMMVNLNETAGFQLGRILLANQ